MHLRSYRVHWLLPFLAFALASSSIFLRTARADETTPRKVQAPTPIEAAPAAKAPAAAAADPAPAVEPVPTTELAPTTESAPSAESPKAADAVSPRSTGRLTEEDREALEKGPIPMGRYIGGGIASTAFGYGVGQAIQGRYGQTGWIFTVTEVVSTGVYIYGITQSSFSCLGSNIYSYSYNYGGCNVSISPAFWVGIAALVGFHIWDIIDAWIMPLRQNHAYNHSKAKQGPAQKEGAFSPYLAPTSNTSLALGFQYRF